MAEDLDLESFAHVVAHDLSAPIRGLSIHLKLLRQEVEQGDTDGALERVEQLQDRLRRMDTMLRRVRGFARLSLAEGGEIHVAAMVQDAWEHVGEGDLHVTGDARIQAPPLLVFTAIHALLDNAVRHHDRTARVQVLIEDEGGAQISIQDDGPGLPAPPDELFTLFAKKGGRIEEGAGTGLAMARLIARHLGGDLTIAALAPRGTRAVLRLPA